jgi:glutamate dehydrogenase
LIADLFQSAVHDPKNAANSQTIGDSGLRGGYRSTVNLKKSIALDQDRILRMIDHARLKPHCAPTIIKSSENGEGKAKSYLSVKLDCAKVPELPAAAPLPRDFRLQPARRGYSPAQRLDRTRRHSLVRPPRGFPYRSFGPDENADRSKTRSSCRWVPKAASSSSIRQRKPDAQKRFMAEGIECYKIFIRGLLDITDNLQGRQSHPAERCHAPRSVMILTSSSPPTRAPRRFLRHRQRALSIEYGFWLERCVRFGRLRRLRPQENGHHRARRLGIRQLPFPQLNGQQHPGKNRSTVIGVGDMGGDVFGNGMAAVPEHIQP